MSLVLVYGALGLLFGLAAQGGGFSRREGVTGAVGFLRWDSARTALYTLGFGMILTAGLCYLAVIDVDQLLIAPLHAGMLLGGVVFGIAMGAGGLLPGTALCGIGGGRLIESLCGALGCVAGAWLGSLLPVERLQTLFTPLEGTLFHLTLRDRQLLSGSFLTLACLGVVVCVAALCVPRARRPENEEPMAVEGSAPPEEAPDDAFVAILPQEEPMVVDTAADMAAEEPVPAPSTDDPAEEPVQEPSTDEPMEEPVLEPSDDPPAEEADMAPEDMPAAHLSTPLPFEGLMDTDVLPHWLNEPDITATPTIKEEEKHMKPCKKRCKKSTKESEPVMKDHAELETPVKDPEGPDAMMELGMRAGLAAPLQEEAMPVPAAAPLTLLDDDDAEERRE